jgi:hypothetical protein
VPDPGRTPRWAVPVEFALLALLAIDTALYFLFGTRNEALDSTAWLALLVSFNVEAGLRRRFDASRTTLALRGIRLLAAVALAAAAVGYARDREWLDTLNTGLWIAVVVLLDFKLRHPARARQSARAFAAAAAVLYAGLAALVAAWLLRGEWFDAYDAALWLAAFAILELDWLGGAGSDKT